MHFGDTAELTSSSDNGLGVLEAAAQYALEAQDEASRDAAVNVAMGACGRALARGDLQLAAPASKIAARVARLASGRRPLPRLPDLVDAILGWTLDPGVPRRASLALVEALGNFGEAAWRAQRATALALSLDLDADLRALADGATDDMSAQRAAAVARCLVAVVRNASFAALQHANDESVAARCVASLQRARRAVSDVEAWDELTVDLAQVLATSLPPDSAWPLVFCRVGACLAGGAVEACAPPGDPVRRAARLLRCVDKYAAWQQSARLSGDARRRLFAASLPGGTKDAVPDVSSLGSLLLSLRRELAAVVVVVGRGGGGGGGGGDDADDDDARRPRALVAATRRRQRQRPQRGAVLAEADEAAVSEARDLLFASQRDLVAGNADVLFAAALLAARGDDVPEYAWLADLGAAHARVADEDPLDVLCSLVPPEYNRRHCWNDWLARVAKTKTTSLGGGGGKKPAAAAAAARALELATGALVARKEADDEAPAAVAAVDALVSTGARPAARCSSDLVAALERVAVGAHAVDCAIAAASCLARLCEVLAAARDAALDVAAAFGGGRELVVTRPDARETARSAERVARALVLSAARAGRAVSSSKASGSQGTARCLLAINHRPQRHHHHHHRNPRGRGRPKEPAPAPDPSDPWPLDSPFWADASAHAASKDDREARDDEVGAMLEALLSPAASKKLASSETATAEPPPPLPLPPEPSSPPQELTVVLPGTQQQTPPSRGAAAAAKRSSSNNAGSAEGKKMLMLRRSAAAAAAAAAAAESDAVPPEAAAAAAPPVVVGSSSSRSGRREAPGRAAPAAAFARAVARHAVGARLKTRLGGAAATLGALREELNLETSSAGDSTLALVEAFEQEMAAASELLPRAGDDDVALSFGETALRPALPAAAFFRQNRAVCDEWLASIRLPAAEVAARHRLFAVAAYHAEAAADDAKRANDDAKWRRAAAVLALARAALGDEAGCLSAAAADDFWWLRAAADVAAGRYEPAATVLFDDEKIFDESPPVVALCVELLARCAAALGTDEQNFAAADIVARRQHADALAEALRPRRAALALDRWACPPDDFVEAEEWRRAWSRPARTFDVAAALEGRNLDDDIIAVCTLAPPNASEDAALFDLDRKVPPLPLGGGGDETRVPRDVGRLRAVVAAANDDDDDAVAALAVAAREASCPRLAAKALESLRGGALTFVALERSRLCVDENSSERRRRFLGAALEAAPNDLALSRAPGAWLAEALAAAAEMVGVDAAFDAAARAAARRVLDDDDDQNAAAARNARGTCLAAAATLAPTGRAWARLGAWCEAAGDARGAKRAFAAALNAGGNDDEARRLCAIRAARLLGTSSHEEDEADALLADRTPEGTWKHLAPQLVAEGMGSLTSPGFRLSRRVALAFPKSVVHAVVVGCRESRGHLALDEQPAARSSSAVREDDDDDDDDEEEEEEEEEDALIEEDDVEEVGGLEDEDEEEKPRQKFFPTTQNKARRIGAQREEDDAWARGATAFRALRAELALSGAATRALLRGAELAVDELRSIATLPDDRWRLALQSSSLTRLPDLATVRALSGYARSDDGDDEAEAAREMAAYKSRALAAPARRHLERARKDLEHHLRRRRRSYDLAFAGRAGPLVDAAVAALAHVDAVSRRKKRGGLERKLDEAWMGALEALGALRENIIDAPAAAGWRGGEISPALESSSVDEELWLPVVRSRSGLCRVSRLSDRVVPLSSKTRPKKLAFACDDGATRAFLLKGAEDVHLDERVMQLLGVVNDILGKKHHPRPPLVATYAVLPLSRKSGLIEWVPRTRPLFQLYNAEQLSRATSRAIAERHKLKKPGGGGLLLEQQQHQLPPHNFRYDALPRAFHLELEKREVVRSEPRSAWPKETLRAVFDALASEAPGGLVARELWRGSRDAGAWLARRDTYARKLGTSCVSAFALGLGDRHLENVLYDDDDGSIVDVDWGVCFDAGTRLRVPEKVPFRLTRVLSAPLPRGGLSDGAFVRSGRALLGDLRSDRGSAAFLGLLDLCCRDARVEWRATLGAARRAAPDAAGAAKTQTRLKKLGDEKKAAALALAGARCLEAGKDWLLSAAEARGSTLRNALKAIDALADAPPSTQLPAPQHHEEALAAALDQRRADCKLAAARRDLATKARSSAEVAVREAVDTLDRTRRERRAALGRLLAPRAEAVQELRFRANALSQRAPMLLDLRDDASVSRAARAAHRAIVEARRQQQQRSPAAATACATTTTTSSSSSGGGGGGGGGSFFSAEDPFSFKPPPPPPQQQVMAAATTPWGSSGETAAERLRRQQQAPARPQDSEENRLLWRLVEECEAEVVASASQQDLGLSAERALNEVAVAIDRFQPFASLVDELRPDDEDAARVERDAAIARHRRRRVVACLEKFEASRQRAKGTLATCRGHARRAIRAARPSAAAVDILAADLEKAPPLDVDDPSSHPETAVAVSKTLVSRLLFLEQQQQQQHDYSLSSAAISEALWCLAYVFDADVADANPSSSSSSIVARTVGRLEAIHDVAAGLAVVVEGCDDWAAADELARGLSALARLADAASKVARDAARAFAGSIFETGAEAPDLPRRVSESVERLFAPSEQALELAAHHLDRARTTSLSEARRDVSLAVLDAKRISTAKGAPHKYAALARCDAAEAACADAVCDALRRVAGGAIEALAATAVSRARSLVGRGDDDSTLGCLSLAAAAQANARLDRASDRDALARLHHHLARRERRAADLAIARARASAAWAAPSDLATVPEVVATFDDDDEDEVDLDRQRRAFAPAAMARARRAAVDRAAFCGRLAAARRSLATVSEATRLAVDRRLARKTALTAALRRADASAAWPRLDAHLAAATTLRTWLSEACVLAAAAAPWDETSLPSVPSARLALDRASADDAAAIAFEAAAHRAVAKAASSLSESREARNKIDRARDAARDWKSVANALFFAPKKRRNSKPREAPWAECAARSRELAALSLVDDAPPGLPAGPSREARKLERTFADVDRLDLALRDLFSNDAFQALKEAPVLPPGTKNRVLDDAAKLARRARKADYVLAPRTPPFRRATLRALDGNDHFAKTLVLRVLGVARASCRASAAVLDFADLENFPRSVDAIPVLAGENEEPSPLSPPREEEEDDENEEEEPPPPPPPPPPKVVTRLEAARQALAAASAKLHREDSVEDQLASLVRVATDPDILCEMYEGWAPWI
ncbi:hypothetical protein CTAYLR_002657 [Chrysophaeum taylorii]|uniref:Non-specific serine/threonine protein kinase n=1 Tax=Chrysophaeum taylorii TaxID=2483200 RepID=A0AAD7XKP8_9STRA|nr:hypothetical protein CTAYLR_002657 [Chrysophaeum taylorii]